MTSRPVLEKWLVGAVADHPLRSEWVQGESLDELDQLLARLEEAGVHRLDGKRREFRRLSGPERWSDLYSELAIVDWHVRRGVRVELGSTKHPNPDLILPDLELGVDVTRRARGGLADLRRVVMEEGQGWEPRPKPRVVVTGRPLSIRRGVRDQMSAEIRLALESGQEEVDVVVRPAVVGRPAMTAHISLFGGRSVLPRFVLLPSAEDLTVTTGDVEQVVRECLQDPRKRAQAEAMSSILLIDAAELSDTLVPARYRDPLCRRAP